MIRKMDRNIHRIAEALLVSTYLQYFYIIKCYYFVDLIETISKSVLKIWRIAFVAYRHSSNLIRPLISTN